ncbi:hypothetical protein ACS5PK_14000 [Roseateles sp. DB2]|uniref:hypothetical protein n=1 Tax=Roseateles sp. DB2 TaxID=3453717 RepID=UPI003EEF35BF
MRLEARLQTELPALAWCMQLQQGDEAAQVDHGAEVLVLPDAIAEGCWAGALSAEGLLTADVCAATGVALHQGALWLCTPTHTLSRLHSLRLGSRLLVSNSLALVCAAAGRELDAGYAFYKDDFCSIQDGLSLARRSVPLADGHQLHLHYHCNVRVGADLRLQEQAKACPDIGSSYESYRALLLERIGAALRNAADERRPVGLQPISTLSRGYDSVTCTVLARELGCQEVLCFRDPEAQEPDADNGAALAARLGMQAHVAQRTAYQALDVCPLFLSTGTGGEDVFLAAHADVLRHRVLISGFHGDKVWDRHASNFSPDIVRGDPSGADLEEFRLDLGFFHLPVPFIACQRKQAIHAISAGEALAAWRVPGDYDRPFCRRLGEDAGLPRESFGMKKRVMSRAFSRGDQISSYLGPHAEPAFRDYLARHPVARRPQDLLLHTLQRGLTALGRTLGRHSYRLQRLLDAAAQRLSRHADDFHAQRALFPWGFAQRLEHYQAAWQRRV